LILKNMKEKKDIQKRMLIEELVQFQFLKLLIFFFN
jgi:hypothetical protein